MYLLRIGICFKLQSFPWNRIGRFYEATDSVRLRTQALTDELSSHRGYGFWITILHDFLKMRKYDFSHTLFFSSFLHKVCSNWLVDGGLRREKMCEFSALPSAWWDTSYIFLCKCQQQNMEMRGNLNIKSHSPVYPLLKPVTTHSQ